MCRGSLIILDLRTRIEEALEVIHTLPLQTRKLTLRVFMRLIRDPIRW